jgi:hypothetical protein
MIVEKVAPQYSLRNGGDIVCVYNMQTYTNGKTRQSTVMPNDKNVKPMQGFEVGGYDDANSSMTSMPQKSMPQFSAPSPQMMPNMANDPMSQMMMQQGGQLQGGSTDPNQSGGDPMTNSMMDGSNPLMQKKSARSRALGLPF